MFLVALPNMCRWFIYILNLVWGNLICMHVESVCVTGAISMKVAQNKIFSIDLEIKMNNQVINTCFYFYLQTKATYGSWIQNNFPKKTTDAGDPLLGKIVSKFLLLF